MLYDIEVTHIDDKNILIKFVFGKVMPASVISRIVQRTTTSEFFSKLVENYNVGTCVCYRDGMKVTQEMADEVLKAIEDLLNIKDDQQGIINDYELTQFSVDTHPELDDVEYFRKQLHRGLRVPKDLL